MATAPIIETARDLLALAQLLGDVEELQWKPAPIPKPREDTDRKAAGGHGDPTGDTALDPRRLELRQAYTRAAATLGEISHSARMARRDLEEAVGRWSGE